MVSRRGPHRGFSRQGRKRPTAWTTRNMTLVTGAGAISAFGVTTADETAIGASFTEFTVLRTVGWVYLRTANVNSIHFGMRLVQDTELSVVGLPTLDVELAPLQDWMLYGRLLNGVVTDPLGEGPHFQRFDLRSKRKLTDAGQQIAFAGKNSSAVAATWEVHLRMLIAY